MIPAGAKENQFTINSLLHPTKQTGCNKPKGSFCWAWPEAKNLGNSFIYQTCAIPYTEGT